jgi:hypothetical protein
MRVNAKEPPGFSRGEDVNEGRVDPAKLATIVKSKSLGSENHQCV